VSHQVRHVNVPCEPVRTLYGARKNLTVHTAQIAATCNVPCGLVIPACRINPHAHPDSCNTCAAEDRSQQCCSDLCRLMRLQTCRQRAAAKLFLFNTHKSVSFDHE